MHNHHCNVWIQTRCVHTHTHDDIQYSSVIGRHCWLLILVYGWLLILVHDFVGRKTEYVVRKYKTSCMKDLADLATLTPACDFFCVLISALSLKSIAPKFGVLSSFSPPLNCNFRGIPTIPGLCLVSYSNPRPQGR